VSDKRIVYGARCTWWDSIDKVGHYKTASGHSLPVCPHCRSPLFEVTNIDEWMRGVDRHEVNGNPGYQALTKWGRGKCFASFDDLRSSYENRVSET
jgi:hypothetical protein